MKSVNFQAIDKKWQEAWAKKKIFEVTEDTNKKKYYVLAMYPYPSGHGLHMGHAFQYIIPDILARYMKMKGYNVLHPMGFDSFGLPAENAAIKEGGHPQKYTAAAIANFVKQLNSLGLGYDWSRRIQSHDSEYYKWNQYFFLQFLKKGLVYRKKSPVNWCSKCESVLANEQVHDGKCWVHKDTTVTVKQLEQWFVKTTKYAEELLRDIAKLDWPERIKTMQENWIGKSEGVEIDFEIPYDKKTNFVLLHGHGGSPNTNFFSWLKKELETRGYEVSVSKLPEPNSPNISNKIEYVLNKEKISENTILLGHSLGGAVALQILEKLDKPIKKLILAAGAIRKEFDFDKIKKNVREGIIYLRDEMDTVIPKNAGDMAKTLLDAKVINFKAEEMHICGLQEPEVLNACVQKWPVFTTRADTLFGVTFLVVSAQHSKLDSLVTAGQKKSVVAFLKKIKSTKQEDFDKMEKEGVFTGSYALHPLTGEKISIWAGNFVVADYGSGMVMGVPAHDARDFEFAKKYKLEIKPVIDSGSKVLKEAYTGNGKMINSGAFNGLDNSEAKEHIVIALNEKKLGRKITQYKLRDWLISRQRYWGTPIPIIYCDSCGAVPVSEKDLPVLLPAKVIFGKGNPLASSKSFVNAKCPTCGKNGRRETDTMDTFFDSSWYYLRFTDNGNKKLPISPDAVSYWMPVDFYTGGAEHACMHLIYARFFTKALRDLGLLRIDEPFPRLFNQGMVHGEDGFVMSKSRGNGIDPLDMTKKYGADTLRLFLISMASPDKDSAWSATGIESMHRFVQRVWEYSHSLKFGKSSARLQHKLNKNILDVGREIENLHYNIAVIKLRTLFDSLEQEIALEDFASFLKLLAPFAPHVAEDLWHSVLNETDFISVAGWPVADESKIDESVDKAEKIVEQTIADVQNVLRIVREKSGKDISHVYLYAIPSEVGLFDGDALKSRLGLDISVFAVNDKKKFDPENKSVKAKPGKPGIYVV